MSYDLDILKGLETRANEREQERDAIANEITKLIGDQDLYTLIRLFNALKTADEYLDRAQERLDEYHNYVLQEAN